MCPASADAPSQRVDTVCLLASLAPAGVVSRDGVRSRRRVAVRCTTKGEQTRMNPVRLQQKGHAGKSTAGVRAWPERALVLALVWSLVAVAIVGCGSDDGGTSRAEPERRRAPSSRAACSRSACSRATSTSTRPSSPAPCSDILLQQQIYEKLVTLGQDFSVQPTLATKWDSPDGKVWTFTLRRAGSSSATARTSPRPTSSTRWTVCAARSSARRWPTSTPTSRSRGAGRDHRRLHARHGRLRVPRVAHRLPHADALQDGQGPGQEGRRHRPVRARVHLGRRPRRAQEERRLLGHRRQRQQAAVP